MELGQDTRGVSEVIGAILIFGLAVMLLAILQTQAIPAANEDVEFNHNDQVQTQLVEFHQVAAETARTGDADSTRLDMGVRYPARLLFFNPPPPSGNLQTSDEQTLHIENVQAEDPTVAKHLNGDRLTLSTRELSYRANYNEYRAAPTTRYEYGVLYNDHADSQLLVNDGGVIQGQDISLLMPAGELHESSARSISIDPRPVSAPANTVAITGANQDDNITLTLPSSMDSALWKDAIDMSNVESVKETGSGEVRIELDPTKTYTLRMARIGVGDDTPAQTPTYLYSQRGLQLDIPQGQSRGLKIEVRDKYNNPVPHQNVTAAIDSGAGSIDRRSSSGGDGVATPRFEAPTEPQRVTVNVTLDDNFTDFDSENDPRDLQLDVWVTSFAGGVGDPPTVEINDSVGTCGDGDLGGTLDDPFESTFGEGDADIVVNWTAATTDEYGIDSVELEMTRNDNGQIVDSTRYTYDDEDSVGDTTHLADENYCNGTYDVRVTAKTTGGATDFVTETIDPDS